MLTFESDIFTEVNHFQKAQVKIISFFFFVANLAPVLKV